MEILTMEQGTPEWFAARCGLVTSSRFKDVMAKGRGNAKSLTRASYMKELVCERITGVVQNSFQSPWMERGNELEAQARAMFELDTGLTVEQVGFIKLSSDIGSSTDGLTGREGVIEIKCPKHTTHLDYLLDHSKLYTSYKAQIQGELWVTGRNKAYLMSFHPDFPEGKDLLILDIERDDEYIKELEESVKSFVSEMNALVNKITEEA